MDEMSKLDREQLVVTYLRQQIEAVKTILDGDDRQYTHLGRNLGRIDGAMETVLFLWPDLEPQTRRDILAILSEGNDIERTGFQSLRTICHVHFNKLSDLSTSKP